MSDYIVRATAADANIRAFAVTSREMVETAREDHMTTPVMTAALGRLLSAGAMMGAMMKGDKDILTLQVKGDGLLQGITVTADSKGRVKGYVVEPDVIIPANAKGKLDVGGAVGHGFLQVIKDMGLKEPYVGQVALQTGEIAEATIEAQTEQVMKNIGNLLAAAGVDYSKVVKTSCFLADMGDFGAFNEIYAKYFTSKPARSCVAVKTLPKNVLCEVEVIAYLGE